ncbi:MAG: class I SAM-dependent methyltransferase [Verrucomicrobiota bacterium]
MKTEGAEDLGSHPDFPASHVYYSRSEEFGFTSPLPSDGELSAYYSGQYRQNRNEAPTEHYLRGMGGRARNQHDYVVGRSGDAVIADVLDVGCAAGSFLETFNRDGARVTGFEPDERMSQKAREVLGESGTVYTKMFEPEMIAPESMDLVSASHVLEHVPNPRQFLASLIRLLKPGGILFVEVPNSSHYTVRRQLVKRHVGNGHLHFFSPRSLQALLETFELELLDVATYGPSLHWYIYFRYITGKWNRYARKLLARATGYGPWPWRLEGELTTRRAKSGASLRCLARVTPLAGAGGDG